MTGLDCLKEELRKRGFTQSQIDKSKMLPEILDILSNSDGEMLKLDGLQKEIRRLEAEKANAEYNLNSFYNYLTRIKADIQSKIALIQKAADDQYKLVTDYITKFFEAISNCETPEARDALRTAQMFINSISIDTKYDNTAFIIGLSAILTRGMVAPIDELQKINPKVPKITIVDNGLGIEIRCNKT